MKVLYVAGWGRSGTTILDNILGGYDRVFAVGELNFLWSRGLNPGRRCGCGELVARCAWWGEVLETAYGTIPLQAQRTADRQRRVGRIRHTRRLSRGPLSGEAAAHRDELRLIYRAIAQVTGAKLIVDSSKTPSGAALLARMPDVESYLLHVVRDPRAVAHSWSRQTKLLAQHSAAHSTAHWVGWNLMTESLARTSFPGRSLRLRYEDFVRWPQAAVETVLRFTGTPVSGGPFRGDSTVALAPNHNFSGNPSRFRSGEIAIRADEEWRSAQPWPPRAVSTALSLPLLPRYGYRVTRPRSRPDSPRR